MEISIHYPLKPLNQTAAALMAAAVIELFPGALIVDGQGTPDRFFYDFVFPFEFQSDFLTMIEERMRLMIREKREVRHLEMMPANAASMMMHRGQTLAAQLLEDINRAVVDICQIGDLALYSREPHLTQLQIPFFKLLEGYSLDLSGQKITRIVGAATLEKHVLKEIAKQPKPSSRSHLKQISESCLLMPLSEAGVWMWCPRGEALRQGMIAFWREEHLKENFSFVSSPVSLIEGGHEENLTEAHKECFFWQVTPRLAEISLVSSSEIPSLALGLLSSKAYFADRAHLFCPDEKLLEECISSLRFILKIPKIFQFEYEIVLCVSRLGTQKARAKAVALLRQALESLDISYSVEKEDRIGVLASIEIHIPDALGRRWTGPSLSVPEAAMPLGKGSMLIRSTFSSLERMLALLLEQKEGWLPLWLVPEQVRILVATSKTDSYARQVCKVLRSEGIRVTVESGKGPLKGRLYEAMTEKVPYVILLGEREEMAAVLTVRAYGESKEQTLSLDEFCMRLKSEMRSETSELTN